MTKPPKTMEEIKNAEAEKYSSKGMVGDWSMNGNFIAGFDCRDKIGDEALKIAVEALNKVMDERDSWKSCGKIAFEALAEIRKLRLENG